MKRSLLLSLLLYVINLNGQNFLANGGFEDINKCEEYGASCAPEAWFRIPPYDLTITDKAQRIPHAGKISEIIVVENKYHPLSRRVFLYTKMLCPLIKGNEYQLSFYLNNLNRKDYTVEALFTSEELIAGIKNPLSFEPNLIFTLEEECEKMDDEGWRKVSATFIADGTEQFLTLGYFSKKEVQLAKNEKTNIKGDIVILIDDVTLTPTDDAEMICTQYESEKLNLYQQNYRHTNKISIDYQPENIRQPEWTDNFFEKPQEISKKINEVKPSPKSVLPHKEWNEKDTLVFEVPYVAFDFDKTLIKENFQSRLDSFAMQIQYLNPSKIQFVGHTDSMGSEDYNQKLSEKRANAVQAYMNQFDYFKTALLESIGKGESQPKADNKTLEGRQKNRRVEIVIFRKL
ncbi:MAG: OmpA family protein [Bacteroidota bacterium]